MIEFAVGFGVLLNLISYELIGFTAGGAVIPGYLALFLDQPARVVTTMAAALITLLVVRWLDRGMILYGRRKFAVTLLVGFLINALVDVVAPRIGPVLGELVGFGGFGGFSGFGVDVRVIGFIVPGLLANEMHGQGVVPTVSVSVAAATVVRLAMMLVLRFGVLSGG